MSEKVLLVSPNELTGMVNTKLNFNCCLSFDVVDRESFNRVLENMRRIGFHEEEVGQILTILAAVLHVGDIVS